MALPDVFIDHDKPERMYERAGLAAPGIVSTVFAALGREQLAKELGDRA
jgi:1-deoxy-D-xylulose-5-phosphate synthase